MSENDNEKKVVRTIIGTAVFIGLSRRYGVLNSLFYGALAITIVIFLLIYLMGRIENRDHDTTWNKVKTGDSLYYEHKATDTTSGGFNPQILIRPVNKADIQMMHIAEWKKKKMINEIDSTLRPQLVDSKYRYMTDSMYKYGSGFIGIFIKKDTLKELGVRQAYGDYWYTFKPKLLHTDCCYIEDIPKGYIISDKKYMYVPAGWVRLEEQIAFVPNEKRKVLSSKKPQSKVTEPVAKIDIHHQKKKALKKHKRKQSQ